MMILTKLLYGLIIVSFQLLLNIGCATAQNIQIVISTSANSAEKNAANQLVRHLGHVYSTSFVVKDERYISGNGPKIFIGRTDFARKEIGDVGKTVGPDGIILKSVGENLIVTGNGDRGILYSVYEFLEKSGGIKFWTATDVSYPEKKQFLLRKLNIQYTPKFKYRSYYNFEANNNAEFATVLRFNGQFQPLQGGWGKPITILGWTHTFDQIIPVRKYFATHPEWFSDPQNKNLPGTKNSKQPDGQETQLCLTDPEMKKEFLKNLLAWIAKNKDVEIISVSQNDRGGFCNCAACKRIIDKEGSASGLLLTFVNDIAKEVAKLYPSKKIITLAYNETEIPPRSIKPAKNVIMQFAPINSDMSSPLNSTQNDQVGKQIQAWRLISNEMFYWGYNNNFSHDLLPYPSLARFTNDLKFLKTNNVDYVFFQGGVLPDNYGYFNKMQAWVVSKLLWNPDLNSEDLIREFFIGYYGDAGNHLLAYYKKIEEAFRKSNTKLKAYHADYSFLTDNDLSALAGDIELALKSAKRDDHKRRVIEEKKSYDYLMIYLNRSTSGARDQFFKKLESYKGKEDLGSRSMSNYSKKLVTSAKTRSITNIDWDKNQRITIEDAHFVLDKKGTVTDRVDDGAAADNSTVFMKASSKAWSIQFPFKSKIVNSAQVYSIIPSIKVQSKQKLVDQQIVFGIYNSKTKQNTFTKKVKLSEYLGSRYKKVILDEIRLDENSLFFVTYPNVYSENIRCYLDNLIIEKK